MMIRFYNKKCRNSKVWNKSYLWWMIERINRDYFNNSIKVKSICFYKDDGQDWWAACNLLKNPWVKIYLNKAAEQAPRFVIENLIFHEILHVIYKNHTKGFKNDERKYPNYRKATIWLTKNDSPHIRMIRRLKDEFKLTFGDIAEIYDFSTYKVKKLYQKQKNNLKLKKEVV